MPRVTEEHRAAMRERIQAAAMQVARTKGLGALTMSDIIAESGLSAGAIYGYYKGKDDLVVDVAHAVMSGRREVLADLASRSPVPPPVEAVPELLASLPTHWLEGGLLLQFWAAAGGRPSIMESAAEMVGAIRASIEGYLAAWFAQETGDPQAAAERAAVLAPAVAGLAQGYVLQASLTPGAGLTPYVDGVVALLQGRLAPSGADLPGDR